MSVYTVAIAVESMNYGGPEEGGWWYTYGEPSTEHTHMLRMRVFENEKEAYAYCRNLNATYIEDYNEREYEHDYSSVLGGERIGAWVWEDEYPSYFYDTPGCKERPHYE